MKSIVFMFSKIYSRFYFEKKMSFQTDGRLQWSQSVLCATATDSAQQRANTLGGTKVSEATATVAHMLLMFCRTTFGAIETVQSPL